MLPKICRTDALAYAFGIFFVLALSGCGSLKLDERRELPIPLEVTLAAEERVNLATGGRPSPIVVRLFELSHSTQFLSADYFALMGQDGVPLGGEMLTSEEHIMLPGEVKMVRKRAALKTRFLGVIAGYRDLASSTWRAVVPIPEPYLEGRVWTKTVSPTKYLFVVLGERGMTIHEKQPGKK
ncbi:MAG: type VI secretion system lipoprotein TssJ [Oscillospiraceae bacterium]|nr:type VI secretion system lipoprotein TssJ [Oscillospiraceae bacterium]